MMNNSTLLNTKSTYAEFTINWETIHAAWFATYLVTSLASFVGNILLTVVIYQTRALRTSTGYFVVYMAASDIFLPFCYLVDDIVFQRKDVGYLSQTTGTVFCKFNDLFWNISCGVSILSLMVIVAYRFCAVVFPMRAREQSRRTCIILLLLTWVLPIVMPSPTFIFVKFSSKNQYCYTDFSIQRLHLRMIWDTIRVSLSLFLPLLVMLILYPVIIVKLRRQKIPGNANCSQALIKRRKQNFRLTTMFITITVAFIVCWGMIRVMYLIDWVSFVIDCCTVDKVVNIVSLFPVVFHAVNPLMYFIFCLSNRQGIRQLLACCCRRAHVHHPLAVIR